ncbi:GrpB family protein [Brevundimonas sp. NPDC055812]
MSIVVRMITILPHETSWAMRRADEVARLKSRLGDLLIEHVGSTAVPGLAAKPVIDLLVGLDDSSDEERVSRCLKALGYQKGQSQSNEPRTFFFERTDDSAGTFHLHVAPRDSVYWRDMINFRDALRTDEDLAYEYVALKQRLAATFAYDIDAYSAGKSDFVARALRGKK